jgi:hypothetical protein
MATQQVGQWNFNSEHVQDHGVTSGKDFVSSETIVVCAVPAGGTGLTSPSNWIPIGLLENVSLQQNKQLAQLFEIGSKKSFIIPGRTFKRMNLSRILFNGPSLLKAATLFNIAVDQTATGATSLVSGGTIPVDDVNFSAGLDDVSINNSPGYGATKDTVKEAFDAASNDTSLMSDLFIDLASQFFNRPFNLGFVMQDSEGQGYGAFALENCMVQSHNMTLTGQQTVVMENISIIIDDITPAYAVDQSST